MPQRRTAQTAPWIVAGLAGVVLVALFVTYVVKLRPDEHHARLERLAAKQAVIGDLSVAENAAVSAASTEMLNLLTLSRAHFDSDYQRALDGATGALKSDVSGLKQQTHDAMTQGGFDLTGKIVAAALGDQANSGATVGYTILLRVDGYHSTLPNVPTPQSVAVTEQLIGGNWLASNIVNVGIAS
jgi:hypothetical protein